MNIQLYRILLQQLTAPRKEPEDHAAGSYGIDMNGNFKYSLFRSETAKNQRIDIRDEYSYRHFSEALSLAYSYCDAGFYIYAMFFREKPVLVDLDAALEKMDIPGIVAWLWRTVPVDWEVVGRLLSKMSGGMSPREAFEDVFYNVVGYEKEDMPPLTEQDFADLEAWAAKKTWTVAGKDLDINLFIREFKKNFPEADGFCFGERTAVLTSGRPLAGAAMLKIRYQDLPSQQELQEIDGMDPDRQYEALSVIAAEQ